jgi:hypothetical protein
MSGGTRIIAILTVVASVLALTWATLAQAPKPAERQKWEYCVADEGRGATGMNKYGDEGWEAVAVIQGDGHPPTIYYKRPKTN